MTMTLPKFVVLKSNYNNKYLRYINEDVQVHGFLQFSGDEVLSPYAKFEVEMAKSGNGLVHIRCCYNNKYWVRWSQNHWWIVAGAEEAEEDQSKWSCTLFEPLFTDARTIQFRHVQLGRYACLWRTGPPTESCLYAGSEAPDKDHCDVYTFIDWESRLILPKHIAIKGNNGRYLCASPRNGKTFLMFASESAQDPKVKNTVTVIPNSNPHDERIIVQIKSDSAAKYWKRDSTTNGILPEKVDANADNDMLFVWKETETKNVITLLNKGNGLYCARDTTNQCLSAFTSEIAVPEAQLVVEEVEPN